MNLNWIMNVKLTPFCQFSTPVDFNIVTKKIGLFVCFKFVRNAEWNWSKCVSKFGMDFIEDILVGIDME